MIHTFKWKSSCFQCKKLVKKERKRTKVFITEEDCPESVVSTVAMLRQMMLLLSLSLMLSSIFLSLFLYMLTMLLLCPVNIYKGGLNLPASSPSDEFHNERIHTDGNPKSSERGKENGENCIKIELQK